MANEAAAPDIAQKPTPAYQDTIKAFILQQAQPQSFWENPGARAIPLLGGIMPAIAGVQRQKRVNEASMKAGLFDQVVQQGHLNDGPESLELAQRLGIPLPVLQAGIMESARVRATPAYQSRQFFEQAMPSWHQPAHYGMFPAGGGEYATPEEAKAGFAQGEQAAQEKNAQAFKTFAQNNPHVLAGLGNPEMGRIALDDIGTPYKVAALKEAFPQVSGGGQAPAPIQPVQVPSAQPGTILQSPPSSPRETPGPGSPALQRETVQAQQFQGAGVDPRIARAILGNEGSGDQSISPKGAVSQWQLMPETARPYLPPEMRQLTAPQIQQALRKDPALAQRIGLAHLKDLQEKYPGRPDLVAAAYFSGQSNVDAATGTIKDETLSDGNMTVKQYVGRFMKRYNGQAAPFSQAQGQLPSGSTQVAGPGAGSPQAAQATQAPEEPPHPAVQVKQQLPGLGSFNPNGPRPRLKRSIGVGKEVTITNEEMPLADYAAAWLADQVDQNPMNYRAAYSELAQKKSLPAPEQMKLIQGGVAAKLFDLHETSLVNQGYKTGTAPLAIEAMKRTLDDMGIGLTPEIINAIGNNPLRSQTVEFLKGIGKNQAAIDPTGDVLRRKETTEAVYKSGLEQKQTGEIRADMPLTQLQGGQDIARQYGVPPSATLNDLRHRVQLPAPLEKEGADTDKIVAALHILERYYAATEPREQGTLLQAFKGLTSASFMGLGINPNMRDYKQMAEGLAAIIGTVSTETGGRFAKDDIERYLMAIPNEKLTGDRAAQRFEDFRTILQRPYLSKLHSFFTGTPPLMEEYYRMHPDQRPGAQPSPQSGTPAAQPSPVLPGAPRIPVPGVKR